MQHVVTDDTWFETRSEICLVRDQIRDMLGSRPDQRHAWFETRSEICLVRDQIRDMLVPRPDQRYTWFEIRSEICLADRYANLNLTEYILNLGLRAKRI